MLSHRFTPKEKHSRPHYTMDIDNSTEKVVKTFLRVVIEKFISTRYDRKEESHEVRVKQKLWKIGSKT